MIKNIINLLLLMLIFIFFFYVFNEYISDDSKKSININRKNFDNLLNEKVENLTLLKNDTNNVIFFNSGYNNNENKEKKKREFWKLFEK